MATPRRTSSIFAITAVGAGVFAAAVLVGPRFLISGVDAGGSESAFAADGNMTPAAPVSTGGEVAALPPVNVSSPIATPPVLPTPAPAVHDVPRVGEISVTVRPVDSEGAALRADDEVRWQITVRNTGTVYLWGVYAYLEGHGPVGCSDRRLAPGDTGECIARVRMEAGPYTADAWVTAWTETEEIRSGDLYITFVEG